jgi:transposase
MDATRPDAVVIGVDTHKETHVAVALNGLGARLGQLAVTADGAGYHRLAEWARSMGEVFAVGIEGSGSYGVGLGRALTAAGFRLVDVNRSNRRRRRQLGKSDTIDAELAARAVLAGEADAVPKAADGEVEMIRQLKLARHSAVKARTQTMLTIKTLLVSAPQTLRERFSNVRGRVTLARHLAALHPGELTSPTAAAEKALRTLAQRWLALHAEIHEHDADLERLVQARAPGLTALPGVATGTIAELLVVFGDNPDRIRSDAAFAKLCGVCPIPASSGKTSRHRLDRGGHRQANAALHRVAVTRMRSHPPTIAYVQRRIAEGKSTREIRRCLKRYIAREIFRHLRPRRLTDGEPQAFVEPATAGRAENRLARRGQRTMTSLPA